MPHLSHPPWFDQPNNFCEAYKLWSSPTAVVCTPPHHFFLLWSRYSPQHPVLKTPAIYVLPSTWQTKFQTHTEQRTKCYYTTFHSTCMSQYGLRKFQFLVVYRHSRKSALLVHYLSCGVRQHAWHLWETVITTTSRYVEANFCQLSTAYITDALGNC
jgi:hypothetical protein